MNKKIIITLSIILGVVVLFVILSNFIVVNDCGCASGPCIYDVCERVTLFNQLFTNGG